MSESALLIAAGIHAAICATMAIVSVCAARRNGEF